MSESPPGKPTPSEPKRQPSPGEGLPPIAKAGVDLTKLLLGLLGGTIALLLVVFAMGHLHQRTEHADLIYLAARRTAEQARVVSSDATRMLRQEVSDAVARPEHRPAASQQIEPAVAALRQIPALDQDRSEALARCPAALRATAADSQRPAQLLACLNAIDTLQRESQALPSAESLRLMVDVIRVVQEERSAFWKTWLEMAQLILLNLLLPIVTAVLGYTFATRSAKGDRDEG